MQKTKPVTRIFIAHTSFSPLKNAFLPRYECILPLIRMAFFQTINSVRPLSKYDGRTECFLGETKSYNEIYSNNITRAPALSISGIVAPTGAPI